MVSVNFGIDLGTTNSLIAKYEHNKVRVFKNPVGQKETLASFVAYRKDRILIGDKAREYLIKDPVNVFGGFKRKMGTDEKYYVVNIDENVTPLELSSLILKELKNFVQTPEPIDACVITIPASFDSTQSNATLKAGEEAGFKHVFLLQEPIAASLAFFNAQGAAAKQDGNWLVYDFGGGTFDVALVRSTQDELKVTDHEGNNFLGGMDLDFALTDKLIIPQIIKQTGIENFEEEFRVKHGKYEMLYYQVMYYAEEAKKQLSVSDTAEIEFSAVLDGNNYDFYIPITKAQTEEIFKPVIDETVALVEKVLSNNDLAAADINEIILVGGSTYLPQVREQLEERTGIRINYSVDPTTCVAVGAAYYAANKFYEPAAKEKPAEEHTADELIATIDFDPVDVEVELSYSRSSRDNEEVLIISTAGEYTNKYYRIIRLDGGFDTGLINLQAKKTEFLPLIPEHNNQFVLHIYDSQKTEIKKLAKEINIAQGIYNIDGQPLPHDISIEIDDVENKTTKLEVIFERNSLLPQKRTLYREISKTIKKGSADSVIINILEGDKNSRASSNLTVGCIVISGKDLQSDLIKGSDIEIQVHITDSRILHTAVYLVMTQQEFKNVFSVSEKQVNVERLKEQYIQLENELTETVKQFQYNENEIWEIKAAAFLEELRALQPRLFKLNTRDKSDEKYVIAEKMSRISQDVDNLGGNERIAMLLEEYLYSKEAVAGVIDAMDFRKEELRKDFQKLQQSEPAFMRSKNAAIIQNKIKQLTELHRIALSNTISYLIWIFIEYKAYEPADFKDFASAKNIMKRADAALADEKYTEFKTHVFSISALLKKTNNNINPDFKGTGIG